MRPVPSRAGDDKIFEGSIINVISDIALALAKAAESTLQGHPAGCLLLDLPLAELLALIRAFLGAIAVKPSRLPSVTKMPLPISCWRLFTRSLISTSFSRARAAGRAKDAERPAFLR